MIPNQLIFLILFLGFSLIGKADSIELTQDTLAVVAEQNIVESTLAKTPIVPFEDTIFYIHSNIGSFSITERAEAITNKIKELSRNRNYNIDSIKTIRGDNFIEIGYEDFIIMSVLPKDAAIENTTIDTLSENYRSIIIATVKEHRENVSWKAILKQIGLALLVVVALFFIIKYINRLYHKALKKINSLQGTKLKGISIRSYSILDAEKETKLIGFFTNVFRYFCIALLLYLSLPLLFSIFPATQHLAETLLGYVLHPLEKILKNVIQYIPNLITIIVIVFIFKYLIKGLKYLAQEIAEGKITLKGFYPDWATTTFAIVKTVLYLFMLIVIFPYLPGSGSDAFKGISVFLGVIISLGSTSLISNVVSGLVLTYMRPFKVGDRIKIGEITGNVVEKTPFVTRLRTPKNEVITIPNSNIMSAHTVNYSNSAREEGVVIHSSVTIGYDAPWREIHKLLLNAAEKTNYIQKTPPPFVLQVALNDFYVEYQINAYTKEEDLMPKIYSELHQNIQDLFNEAGMEIMSPHYRAERDGNHIAIPEEYIKEKP